MSENEETSEIESDAPERGRAFLRVDALPAKDGGGIVFPDGPLGRSFRLDEWAFIRYCTNRAEANHAEATKPPIKKLIEALPWIAAIVIFTAVAMRVENTAGIGAAGLYGGLIIILMGGETLRWHDAFRGKPKQFLADFPNASPVPFFKFWRERISLEVTQKSRNWIWDRAWRFFWPLTMAEQAASQRAESPVPDIIVYAFVAYGVWSGLLLLAFGIGYQAIRRRLGRAPTREDLQPV